MLYQNLKNQLPIDSSMEVRKTSSDTRWFIAHCAKSQKYEQGKVKIGLHLSLPSKPICQKGWDGRSMLGQPWKGHPCRILILFLIMFYYTISITYQKIGKLFCPVILLDFGTVWLAPCRFNLIRITKETPSILHPSKIYKIWGYKVFFSIMFYYISSTNADYGQRSMCLNGVF
jgi:hypothetical protein